MAPHSSTLAWKIPWTEEPGGLQSMGSLGVRHDRATSLSLVTFMHWRRKWQPTPVFLPGESQGLGSLVGCCLSGRTASDTTEATQQQQQQQCVHFSHNLPIHPTSRLYVQVYMSVLYVCISIPIFIDSTCSLIYDIYFSLSDFTVLRQTLGPSTSLQMTSFCSFMSE